MMANLYGAHPATASCTCVYVAPCRTVATRTLLLHHVTLYTRWTPLLLPLLVEMGVRSWPQACWPQRTCAAVGSPGVTVSAVKHRLLHACSFSTMHMLRVSGIVGAGKSTTLLCLVRCGLQ